MTEILHPVSRRVRRITLDADGVLLSGLLIEPSLLPPRAVVVAVHGGGMRAGYFDGQARPGLSLLELGAGLGFTVLALDRPGYGLSAAQLPEGQSLAAQSMTLHTALAAFARRHPVGAGFFLIAHSFGGKLALTAAAAGAAEETFIGLDISGCGHQYAIDLDELPDARSRAGWRLNWGALRLYPPDTFSSTRPLVAPVPAWERKEASDWPDMITDVAPLVRVPARLTFAEHEGWWRHDEEAVASLTGMLAGARAVVDRQPYAGHNISLGWAARSYHLRALGFLEECLSRREVALKSTG
ncbi:alpha/beta fold hydrolase [Streptomyces sp. ISL-98]|uniref:alpha/beta hydrolase n=1 Tax=Streptomyces sp. ISL-98 TaxID=2819192 RepID=UPI001BE7B03C|nr:alpha/beta fold hydrolase [Streptomyces sp. ISL-98]MBT2510415.1 alpha/beta fold hydrolase [Streptomyces sp. ISL-98]